MEYKIPIIFDCRDFCLYLYVQKYKMEAQIEPKKKGRPKKDEGAKMVRVELRLTVEQKELLDLAVSKGYVKQTQTEILLKGLHNYCATVATDWYSGETWKHGYKITHTK